MLHIRVSDLIHLVAENVQLFHQSLLIEIPHLLALNNQFPILFL